MRLWIQTVANLAVRLFYRARFIGSEVPAQGPLLLVGNHPNGLIDPVLLGMSTRRVVRFLAKAPLFDMPGLGWVMRGIRALPIYRSMDGADTDLNKDTFRAVFDALGKGDVVCLFPEGTSQAVTTIQKLKTGAARMALGAEAQHAFRLGVRIVPVGLVYRASRRFGSEVGVWVGEPIEIADLREAHAKDERACVHTLTERIAEGLREVNLELDHWEDLPLLELAERIWRPGEGERLEHMRAFATALRTLRSEGRGEKIEELARRIASFRSRLRRLGASVHDLDVQYTRQSVGAFVVRNLLLLILGLPLALVGVAAFSVPYQLTPLLTRLVAPTREMYATVQILAGLILFPVWMLLLVLAAGLLAGPGIAFCVLIGAPVVGRLALEHMEWRAERVADVAAFLRLGKRASLKAHLVRERDALAAEIEAMWRGTKQENTTRDRA